MVDLYVVDFSGPKPNSLIIYTKKRHKEGNIKEEGEILKINGW
jgi:hypothetical protein